MRSLPRSSETFTCWARKRVTPGHTHQTNRLANESYPHWLCRSAFGYELSLSSLCSQGPRRSKSHAKSLGWSALNLSENHGETTNVFVHRPVTDNLQLCDPAVSSSLLHLFARVHVYKRNVLISRCRAKKESTNFRFLRVTLLARR